MSNINAAPARGKTNRPHIAIAGAGIGGLAAALALRQRGFAPVVFEKKSAEQIRTEGVFLTLAPNGINALRTLGLADAVVDAGLLTRGLAMFNERGKELSVMDYGSHRARFGAPSVTIGRGALGAALLDAALAKDIDIRFGRGIEAIGQHRDGVEIDGEPFDALIGADGLRSRVRALVFPELPQPRYSGLIGTGGVTWVDGIKPTNGLMNMTFGRKAFFGYLAEPGQPVMWFNTYPADETRSGPVTDPRGYARFIESLHRDDPLDNARILAGVDEIDRHYPIYDMPELPHWSKGRVLLMGDAAHAVAPHSGQGASMAIEDALVLSAALEASDSVETAFARFFALRQERTQRVIAIGRMAGSQKHAQSWLQLRIRDLLLPVFMPMGVKAQESIFRLRVDQNPLAPPAQ
ncbi:MAG TPA: FAD-dependent monooxygenase [Devosia sp.]|jgi:2-polyprenyl-6-methoxyphenol hydroxylase-like FAD-dependent oxidoreductase|nr:FAD-dependent monooxygenase [Devosia sp.]